MSKAILKREVYLSDIFPLKLILLEAYGSITRGDKDI